MNAVEGSPDQLYFVNIRRRSFDYVPSTRDFTQDDIYKNTTRPPVQLRFK